MKDHNSICVVSALEVLVTSYRGVIGNSWGCLGQKEIGNSFRRHGLREHFIEGEPKNKRTQIINIGHSTEAVAEPGLCIEVNFLTTLAHLGCSNSPVGNTEESQVYERPIAGSSSE